MENEILEYINNQPEEITMLIKYAQNAGFIVYVEPNENFPSWFKSDIPSLIYLCKKFEITSVLLLKEFTKENVIDSRKYFLKLYDSCMSGSFCWESTAAFHVVLLLIRRYKDQINPSELIDQGWSHKIAECVLNA